MGFGNPAMWHGLRSQSRFGDPDMWASFRPQSRFGDLAMWQWLRPQPRFGDLAMWQWFRSSLFCNARCVYLPVAHSYYAYFFCRIIAIQKLELKFANINIKNSF